MNMWQYLIPIIVTLALNLIVLFTTNFLNKRKQSSEIKQTNANTEKTRSETDKIDAERENIQSQMWKELYDKLEQKNKEIEARLLALEESKKELEELIERERGTRYRLQVIIEGIQLWFARNRKKLEEACIEPFPSVDIT